jgi:hypothetical protein
MMAGCWVEPTRVHICAMHSERVHVHTSVRKHMWYRKSNQHAQIINHTNLCVIINTFIQQSQTIKANTNCTILPNSCKL